MSDSVSRALGEYAASLRFEDIPDAVLEHTRLLVLDSLVCGMLGLGRAEVRSLTRSLTRSESGTAHVWGGGPGLSAPSTAMVNATAVHAFELDDIATGLHYGSSVLPPALAIAELAPLAGRRLITALVAGCEVAARLQSAVGRTPHAVVGFHGPSVMGTFGAAVTAAVALGLDGVGIGHAIGHAAQQASGLMATQSGGMGKRLLAGVSARNGTFAALLAADGFTSADDMLERSYGGFFPAISGGADTWDAERAVDPAPRWATLETRFKFWACRFPIHPALEGLRELRAEHGLDPATIAGVEVELDAAAMKAVGFPWTPSSTASAQMNLGVCVASFLLDDDVFLPQFAPDALARPELLELVSRVRAVAAPADGGLFKREAPVRVTLVDGRALETIGRVRGGFDDPSTPTLVQRKADRISAALGIAPAFVAGFDWDHIDELPDAVRLIDHLTAVEGLPT